MQSPCSVPTYSSRDYQVCSCRVLHENVHCQCRQWMTQVCALRVKSGKKGDYCVIDSGKQVPVHSTVAVVGWNLKEGDCKMLKET